VTPAEFRAARKLLGWSQALLAQKLGMKSEKSIRRMEKGESPIHKRTEIAVEKLLADMGLELPKLAEEADDGSR
jgi:transcriptional regulator with XRE-family HTH domain